MSPEEIELYKDAIKIGVPAIVGLLAGLVPYLIERNKVSTQRMIEKDKSKRELVLSFSDALSQYIGSSSAYISYLLSKEFNRGEEWDKSVSESAKKMLDNEVDRTRAKALSGIIGDTEVIDSILEYDKCVTNVISLLAHPKRPDKTEKETVLNRMKESEKVLLHSLSKLL
ncbi:hypothetical protein [Vibrio crassostreae]|uniref:hypothetical protein n=1 Tax=Vibrio crassostreae TaxID=246167 RepID=UPI000F46EE09|nr:hypothetical protein [Vibrio crassostreae]ROS70921.1 hypothetical protein EDB73_101600 [Vibrio crassostreae]